MELTPRLPLTNRQIELLLIVAEGGGDWDAWRIELTVGIRLGPGEGTVLQELEAIARLGLVVCDHSELSVGGRWAVTDRARWYLR